MNARRAVERIVRRPKVQAVQRRLVGYATCLILSTVSLGASLPVQAAQGPSSRRGYLVAMVLWRGVTDAERGFMDYFSEHGVPVRFVQFNCNADKKRLPGYIAKLKALHPDLIYTFGTTVTSAVAGKEGKVDPKLNITKIPIVFNIVADPIGAGITRSMRSTGRNVTGITHTVPLKVQLKTLMELKTAHRLGVIYNPQEKNSVLAVQHLAAARKAFGFRLLSAPLHMGGTRPAADRITEAVRELAKQRPDLIYLPSDSYLIAHADIVTADINRLGIPSFSATEGPVRDSGALMGMVSRYYNAGKFAAFKAMEILVEHRRPQDIPVEGLKRFTVVVNMDTARQLDFYPPVTLLNLAEVVEKRPRAAPRH